jgi:hypothetical protein
MKRVGRHRHIGIAGVTLAIASLAVGVGTAWAASPTWICVPEETGKPVTSGGTQGKCEAKNTTVELPPTAELATLNKILPHIAYIAEGIDKKPTIQFSGVNVKIINGEGKTASVNGEGNLIIGYDEEPNGQTGSHNLIVGGNQSYTSYGGILAGFRNSISAPYATITGGYKNTANGEWASVSGGEHNTASGGDASVSGGWENTASAQAASVSGGGENTANTGDTSISGGYKNTAGDYPIANGFYASILGGYKNVADSNFTTIYGGKEVTASKEYEAAG